MGNLLHLDPKLFVAPYNAQATLHWYKAFWALYLPSTVPGRVSDIWRSYFAQAIFPMIGLKTAFLPRPLVVQERNIHSNIGDFEAEQDLYLKSDALVLLLRELQEHNNFTDMPDAIESTWIAFYERGYIDIQDVYLIQLWITSLLLVGYEFPFLEDTSTQQTAFREDCEESSQEGNIFSLQNVNSIATKTFQLQEAQTYFKCNVKNVFFGNANLHSGVMDDLTTILSHMNQSVVRMGRKLKSKYYPELNDIQGVTFVEQLSPVLAKYSKHSTPLEKEWPLENFNFYK